MAGKGEACAVATANPEGCALSGKRVRGMSKGGGQRVDLEGLKEAPQQADACAVAHVNLEGCALSGK